MVSRGWATPSASVTTAVCVLPSSVFRATASPPSTALNLWDVMEARSSCTDRSAVDSLRARGGKLLVTKRLPPSEVGTIEDSRR